MSKLKGGETREIKKEQSSTFGFELYIFDQSGTRHKFRIYIVLSTSSGNKMTILKTRYQLPKKEKKKKSYP